MAEYIDRGAFLAKERAWYCKNCDGDESELHFCFSCGAKMEG